MVPLVRIVRAVRTVHASHDMCPWRAPCELCRIDANSYLSKRLYQGGPQVAACAPCYDSCRSLCAEAQALPAAQWQEPAHSHVVVAQRVALLRALPEVRVIGAAGDLATQAFVRCIWCDQSMKGNSVFLVTPKELGKTYPEVKGHSWTYFLHSWCRGALDRTVLTEWTARCVRSQVHRLPIVDDVRHLLSLFVCRVSAIGVEAASVAHCPVW